MGWHTGTGTVDDLVDARDKGVDLGLESAQLHKGTRVRDWSGGKESNRQ